ncbi:MAG: peptide chain release factor 1 [Burkholderiaceae bacterium]
MNESMLSRLQDLEYRLEEVNALLSEGDAAADMNQFRKLSREHAELTDVVSHFHAYNRALADQGAATQMRHDPELREFADEELASARQRLETESDTLRRLLLPRDPDDSRNAFVEIRAGTGGDESALFAGDLLRMYTRYAENSGWQVELVSASESDLGGYRDAVMRISSSSSPAPFGILKFESGGHRVQRVPETETQGRIHTSACTVAVLAEPDEQTEVKINPDELRIDVYRASGAGGQHVNKTESAVRITHLPTGIVAECQDDRSQHRNRDKAMQVLAARIKDKRDREEQQAQAAHRRSLIGSGDRSERIRTYNFPQGRVTDHRINLTLYKLDKIIAGDMQELIDALRSADQAEQLGELVDGTA